MLKSKLFVYTMSIYLYLLLENHGISAVLQFKPLQSSVSIFKKEVFSHLDSSSASHICVWSHKTEILETFGDFLISLASTGKSVCSLKLSEEVSFPRNCLHNVVLLQNFTSCGNIWRTRRPITALHFVYVVVDTKWESGGEGLPSCFAVFGYARVVSVFLQNERVFSLSAPQFPPRRFSETQPGDLSSPVEVVFNNLKGREVDVATFNCSPYVIFSQGYDAEFMDGIEGRVLKELAALMNFKINIVERSKERYGNYTSTSWGKGGIMGALNSYDVDIGMCNIWSDMRNIQVLDFGPFNNMVSYTFLVPRPKLIDEIWKNLTGIFKLNVWLAAVCCYCICSFCYWLRCNIFAPKDRVDPVESLLTVLGMLTLTSWHTKRAARQLILWWLVFVLLLTATYSSGIAARLTRPRYEPRIDTIQQLVDLDFHWYGDNVTNELKDFLLNNSNQAEKEWKDRYNFLPAHMTPSAVRSRNYAFLVQRLGLSMVVVNIHGLHYDRDLQDMRILKTKIIDNIFSCFGIPKQSALSYSLQSALLQMRQMGLIDRWTQHAVQQLTPKYIQYLQQEQDEAVLAHLTPLSMHNLSAAFYILLTGLIMSSACFSMEMLYRRYTNRDNP